MKVHFYRHTKCKRIKPTTIFQILFSLLNSFLFSVYHITIIFLTDRLTQSYVKAYEQEFAHARDVNNLYGEQNAFRYLPLKNMVLRLFPGDNNEDAKMIALAARICHTPLSISFEPGDDRTAALASLGCPLKEEALAGFLKSMKNYERIRTCGADIPMEMYEEAARIDKYIATAKPVKDGRVELIHYIKEQSISFEYHRYGSILEVLPVE